MTEPKTIRGHRLEPHASCAGAALDHARLAGANLAGTRFCKTTMPDLRVNDTDC